MRTNRTSTFNPIWHNQFKNLSKVSTHWRQNQSRKSTSPNVKRQDPTVTPQVHSNSEFARNLINRHRLLLLHGEGRWTSRPVTSLLMHFFVLFLLIFQIARRRGGRPGTSASSAAATSTCGERSQGERTAPGQK